LIWGRIGATQSREGTFVLPALIQRHVLIDCLAAIVREKNLNSRTRRRRAAEGGTLRVSLTSNSSRASLCQEINEEIRFNGTEPKHDLSFAEI
jgi:hypothetical protein